MFDVEVKCCMVVGGWVDMVGFGFGFKNDIICWFFVKNIVIIFDRFGYDCIGMVWFFIVCRNILIGCVDIDWEYFGGNGVDYK